MHQDQLEMTAAPDTDRYTNLFTKESSSTNIHIKGYNGIAETSVCKSMQSHQMKLDMIVEQIPQNRPEIGMVEQICKNR